MKVHTTEQNVGRRTQICAGHSWDLGKRWPAVGLKGKSDALSINGMTVLSLHHLNFEWGRELPGGRRGGGMVELLLEDGGARLTVERWHILIIHGFWTERREGG